MAKSAKIEGTTTIDEAAKLKQKAENERRLLLAAEDSGQRTVNSGQGAGIAGSGGVVARAYGYTDTGSGGSARYYQPSGTNSSGQWSVNSGQRAGVRGQTGAYTIPQVALPDAAKAYGDDATVGYYSDQMQGSYDNYKALQGAYGDQHRSDLNRIDQIQRDTVAQAYKLKTASVNDAAAAYGRSGAGYGANGQAMRDAGLRGSGYSDYMQGLAYQAYRDSVAGANNTYSDAVTAAKQSAEQAAYSADVAYRSNMITAADAYRQDAAKYGEAITERAQKLNDTADAEAKAVKAAYTADYTSEVINGRYIGEMTTAEIEAYSKDAGYTEEQKNNLIAKAQEAYYDTFMNILSGKPDNNGNIAEFSPSDVVSAHNNKNISDEQYKKLAEQYTLLTVGGNINSVFDGLDRTELDKMYDRITGDPILKEVYGSQITELYNKQKSVNDKNEQISNIAARAVKISSFNPGAVLNVNNNNGKTSIGYFKPNGDFPTNVPATKATDEAVIAIAKKAGAGYAFNYKGDIYVLAEDGNVYKLEADDYLEKKLPNKFSGDTSGVVGTEIKN